MPAPNWSFFLLILHVPVNHNIRSSSFIFVTDIVHTFTTFKESYIDILISMLLIKLCLYLNRKRSDAEHVNCHCASKSPQSRS